MPTTDVVTRFRLVAGSTATPAKDVITRFHLSSGVRRKDVITRFRVTQVSSFTVSLANVWRDTVNPFDAIELTIVPSIQADSVSIVQTAGTPVVITGTGIDRDTVAPASWAGTTLTFLVSAVRSGYPTATRSYSVVVRPHGGLYRKDGSAVRVVGKL